MALRFLKDRDENGAVLGNLGASPQRHGTDGELVETALDIYRRDQNNQHEQSVASDLTRCLLRKVFRDTVLQSSKQVRRKYSYSAVGSSVRREMETGNMGITSKLKNMQKERLIVARLGFPDQAMEIDGHIEKIRADLRKEREKEDSRILEAALATLAVQHREKVASLEGELKENAKETAAIFQEERNAVLGKQEKQFAQLVDDAVKRAIGKSKRCSCSKRYLCHHNKTATFNTRRPKKQVIHLRKNAKRLRHGGRLDESVAWEEKAAELDAEHFDEWREEVAANLTASAWGGSSSALDQLASQHQREMSRMESTQASEWTLMLMRHGTLRRNCVNTITAEQRKLRNTCKKNAEKRHRREMLGQAELTEEATPSPRQKLPASTGPQVQRRDGGYRVAHSGHDDVSRKLQEAMEEGTIKTEGPLGGRRARRRQTPVRPSSAPPARGRRPQSHQQASTAAAAAAAAAAGVGGGQGEGDGGEGGGSGSSLSGDSRDLQGFDELERTLSYDNLPVAGLPEEGSDWVHVPWCGASSGDVTTIATNKAPVEPAAPSYSAAHATNTSAVAGGTVSRHLAGGGNATEVVPSCSPEGQVRRRGSGGGCGGSDIGRRPTRRFSSGRSSRLAAAGLLLVAKTVTEEEQEPSRLPRKPLPGKIGSGSGGGSGGGRGGGGGGKGGGPERSSGALPTRTLAGGGELEKYDRGSSLVPKKPSLRAASRLPSENRVEVITANDERKSGTNHKKSVSWGETVEVPPEPSSWEEDHDDDGKATEGDLGDGGDGAGGSTDGFDDVVDDYIDDSDCLEDHEVGINKLEHHDRRPLPFARRGRGRGADDNHWVDGDGIDFANPRQLIPPTTDEEEPSEDWNPSETSLERRKQAGGRASTRVASEESEGGGWSRADRETQHPLQCALDQFCLVSALHGDWPLLLERITGQEAGRSNLYRWSRARSRRWRSSVEEYIKAISAGAADGNLLRGSGRAAAIAVASPCVLAPFIASPSGQRVVRTKAGRKAMGGSIVAEEPALARSRHPWRTLFERALGSLPHGAVLSLAAGGWSEKNTSPQHTTGIGGEEYVAEESAAMSRRRGGDDMKDSPSAAGKVVWANEGFERLAGVDTVDFVGQQLGSLLDLFGVEQGNELAQSFELGTRCMLWITMDGRVRGQGQGQDPTDVLCLHQPIDVPRQLSKEGRYSALFLVDTASVVLAGEEEGGRGRGGGGGGDGDGDGGGGGERGGGGGGGKGGVKEGARRDRRSVPRRAGAESTDRDRERRRQGCQDLSRAIAILLTGDVQNDDVVYDDKDDDDEPTCYTEPLRARRIGDGTITAGEEREEEGDGEQRTLAHNSRNQVSSRPASAPSLEPPRHNPPARRSAVEVPGEDEEKNLNLNNYGRVQGLTSPDSEGVDAGNGEPTTSAMNYRSLLADDMFEAGDRNICDGDHSHDGGGGGGHGGRTSHPGGRGGGDGASCDAFGEALAPTSLAPNCSSATTDGEVAATSAEGLPPTSATATTQEEGKLAGGAVNSTLESAEPNKMELTVSGSTPRQRVSAAAAAAAAAATGEFEYSSGDDSTAEPRDDLLRAPPTSAAGSRTPPASSRGGVGGAQKRGTPRGDAAKGGGDDSLPLPQDHRAFHGGDEEGGSEATDRLPLQEESTWEAGANQYEDDFFFDDEEESSASPDDDTAVDGLGNR